MTGIYVKLLGQPNILKDGQVVLFPYTKINALLYYLFCHQQVSRESLANLLWPNKPSATSRRNLRNGIYQANKILGVEAIISLNRSIVTLNPNLAISGDVNQFLQDPAAHINLYQGPFLSDFYLKDSETFEFWVTKMQARLEKAYSQACFDQLENQTSDLKTKESLLLNLIEMDEFDEKHYQGLMTLYHEQGRTGKAIETYYKLVDLFDRELGVLPSLETRTCYATLLEQDTSYDSTHQQAYTDLLFERVAEIRQLEQFLQAVKTPCHANILVLQGHTGSGKRTLIRKVLADKKNHYTLIRLACQRDDLTKTYHAIYQLIQQLYQLVLQQQFVSLNQWQETYQHYFAATKPLDLQTVPPLHLTHFLLTVIRLASQDKPVLLLIEESHWLDEGSIGILRELLTGLKTLSFALIVTKHKRHANRLDGFLHQLQVTHRINTLELRPLSYEATQEHFRQVFDQTKLPQALLDHIFEVSQGNPFLLSEYMTLLKNGQDWSPLTPAIRSKIALKLGQLSSLEEELLDYLSCCQDGLTTSVLSGLLGISNKDLVSIIDKLCDLHILEQVASQDELHICFYQKVIPYFIYDNLSLAKRKLLHLRIGEYLESLAANYHSKALLESIAYHFFQAKEPLKSLTYHIATLNLTLQFTHELFPVSYDKGHHLSHHQTDTSNIGTTFQTLWQQLLSLEDRYGLSHDFQFLKLQLLYLEGRYLIRIGHYDKGIHNIEQVIIKAKSLNQTDYLIEAYKQIIYYCIQEEQIKELQHYTDLLLEASANANHHEAIGVALRLRGLYYIITGQEALAKQALNSSIDCFSITQSLKDKYAIQIAAALDYLGEIDLINGRFEQAIQQQQQAIALSQTQETGAYNLLFRIRLAISYYWQGNLAQAMTLLQDIPSNTLTEQLPWLDMQVTSYQVLLHLAYKRYDKLLNLLTTTGILTKPLSNKRDIGLQYYLISLLKRCLHQDQKTKAQLDQILTKNDSYYHDLALTHLNAYRDKHFIRSLQTIASQD